MCLSFVVGPSSGRAVVGSTPRWSRCTQGREGDFIAAGGFGCKAGSAGVSVTGSSPAIPAKGVTRPPVSPSSSNCPWTPSIRSAKRGPPVGPCPEGPRTDSRLDVLRTASGRRTEVLLTGVRTARQSGRVAAPEPTRTVREPSGRSGAAGGEERVGHVRGVGLRTLTSDPRAGGRVPLRCSRTGPVCRYLRRCQQRSAPPGCLHSPTSS